MQVEFKFDEKEQEMGIVAVAAMATNGETVLMDYGESCEQIDLMEFWGQIGRDYIRGSSGSIWETYGEMLRALAIVFENVLKEQECE